MNVALTCKTTLSKKLEKFLDNTNSLVLFVEKWDKNQGSATLTFSCKDGTNIDDLKKIGETSILIKIDDAGREADTLGDEKPFQNIYNTKPSSNEVNNKIAIVDPDKEIQGYKNVKKIQDLSEKSKKARECFISSLEELTHILNGIKNLEQEVPQPPVGKRLNRIEAIAFNNRMQGVPKLPMGVYVSNETGGGISVNDLNLTLSPNEVYDLSTLPAKYLINSRDLRICLEKGYIKFRSRGEYGMWFKNTKDGENERDTLPVFDTPEAAENAMEVSSGKEEQVQGSGASKFTNEKPRIKIVKSTKEVLIKDDANQEIKEIKPKEMPQVGGKDTDVADGAEDGSDLSADPTTTELMKTLPKEKSQVLDVPNEEIIDGLQENESKSTLEDGQKSPRKSIKRI